MQAGNPEVARDRLQQCLLPKRQRMDERVTTSINASSYLSVVKRQLKNLKW